jgi:acyl-CoA reductase-like NAD-dependent aldehyde dehydrogenase
VTQPAGGPGVRTLGATPERWGLWLEGAEQVSESRAVAEVVAPFDGRTLAQVEQATAEDVDRAVAIAAAAFGDNRRTPGHVRAGWLRAAAADLAAHADQLADAIVAVLGKPVRLASAEVRRAPFLLEHCAEEIARMSGDHLPLDAVVGGEGRWGFTRREPYGVIAAVTPFNAPVNLLLQKVAPALAMGNAVIVKPAPEGALAALQVCEVLSRHLPPGLLNVVCGGPETATALVSHRTVRAVTLTGGVAAGEAVLASAGIKPVLLELGSNSPNIVCADADLADAAERIAVAAFGASGQQCISAQRVLVDVSVLDAFLEQFVSHSRNLVVGDPADPSTDIGPVVNERARERVLAHIEDAEERGGKVVLDGRRDGLMLGPTVVRDAPRGSRLWREEVFGPVALVCSVADVDEAIERANDSELGLQASCFTSSLATAMRVAEDVRAGVVWINEATRFRLDTYPFGGFGRSGVGREGVRSAMEELSQVKFVGMRPHS